MGLIALIDVDGTLVDTNYHHALAWSRAFRRHGLTFALWRIHRHIGMGGDQLVDALAGDEVEERTGDGLRAAWSEEFDPMLPEIAPVDGARELLAGLRADGARVVLASSGKQRHVEAFLDLIDGREVAEAWTTSDDVAATKPEPDIFRAALDKLGLGDTPPEGSEVVVIGDSTWDCIAAERLGVASLAVRTGGFSDQELREAGARDVFEGLPELARALRS